MRKRVFVRKAITTFLVMAMVIGCLSGCGKGSGNDSSTGSKSSSKSIAGLKDNGDGTYTVTVAVLDAMAPYTYTDEKGQFQGYDYEYMKALDEKLEDYKFEYVAASACGTCSNPGRNLCNVCFCTLCYTCKSRKLFVKYSRKLLSDQLDFQKRG